MQLKKTVQINWSSSLGILPGLAASVVRLVINSSISKYASSTSTSTAQAEYEYDFGLRAKPRQDT